MNKIITYMPSDLKTSVPAFFNTILTDAFNNESIKYVTFVQTDLMLNCKDFNKFVQDYQLFLNIWNLPYVFFPYYAYFNKMLPHSLGIPNPKLDITLADKKHINVVMSPAYGFLILDIDKLKSIDFKFNESYTELYYMQDLIQKCFENNLWLSNSCFLDKHNSWNDLKQVTLDGYAIDSEKFKSERNEYNKLNFTYQSPNDFVIKFKEKYNL